MGGYAYDVLKDALVKVGVGSAKEDVKKSHPAREAFFLGKPEAIAAREKGRKALNEGMLVFVSKETLDHLKTLTGAKSLSKAFMRSLIEDISTGKLLLTTPDQHTNNGNGNGKSKPLPTPTTPLYTLQQAARALGCRPSMLYFRASRGRIAATRQGSRFLLNEDEINRLKACGI